MRVLHLLVLVCCCASWGVSAPADKPSSQSDKTSEQTETTTDKNKKEEEAKSRPWEHEEFGYPPPPGWPHGPVRQYCCPHPVQCQYPPHHLPPPGLDIAPYYRPPLPPYPAYDGMQNRQEEPPQALPDTSASVQTKSIRQRKQSAEQK